jgi:hypothetical protein
MEEAESAAQEAYEKANEATVAVARITEVDENTLRAAEEATKEVEEAT